MLNVIAFLLLAVQAAFVNGGAVVLTAGSIEQILEDNQLVLINFYADWCGFSAMLQPIWDEAADRLAAELPDAKVVFAKVDCEAERELSSKYEITKYPTIKYVQEGVLARQEYRGQRSAEDLLHFVREQITSPIKNFTSIDELVSQLDENNRHMIGFFGSEESPEYKAFRHVAGVHRSDCDFLASFNQLAPGEKDAVSFRPSKSRTNDEDEGYTHDISNKVKLSEWTRSLCVPLVREITFENAEELTEEGKPLIILFHQPDDTDSVKDYNDLVKKELMSQREQVSFVTANGLMFAHPLMHLGKDVSDLPQIAIDSFSHMYLFPTYSKFKEEGALLKFIGDLHSGKLHREYHYGPDEEQEEQQQQQQEDEDYEVSEESKDLEDSKHSEGGAQENKVGSEQRHIPREDESEEEDDDLDLGEMDKTDPPESTFVKLAPSKNRYTLLRDEF